MMNLVIQLRSGGGSERCAFCGKQTGAAGGVQLFLEATQEAVCRDCGKKHAPSLAALLDLARAAERVGRMGRHTVSPPLAALLDLARAAENYACTTPRRCRQHA